MNIRETLLQDIDGYLAQVKVAETTFGRLAVNDGKFVGRLRAGAGVTDRTIEKVQAYISANPVPRNEAA